MAKVYDFLKKDATEIMQIVNDPQCTSRVVLVSKLSDHLNSVRKRTAKAVGTSERTVTSILSEERKSGTFKTPYKDRKKRAKKLELTNYNVEVIRSSIQSHYSEHHELPSLVQLKRVLQEKLNYSGSISTLRTVLLTLGCEWRKTVRRRKVVERPPPPY